MASSNSLLISLSLAISINLSALEGLPMSLVKIHATFQVIPVTVSKRCPKSSSQRFHKNVTAPSTFNQGDDRTLSGQETLAILAGR